MPSDNEMAGSAAMDRPVGRERESINRTTDQRPPLSQRGTPRGRGRRGWLLFTSLVAVEGPKRFNSCWTEAVFGVRPSGTKQAQYPNGGLISALGAEVVFGFRPSTRTILTWTRYSTLTVV